MNLRGRLAGCCLLTALLAGCAGVEKPIETPTPAPKAEKEVTPAAAEETAKSPPLKYLAGRSLKPIPTRPLNVRARCSHKDEDGTRTRLKLLVRNAQVKTFVANVAMPKHGTCRFDLRNFRQTATLPQALLAAKDGSGCTVRLWEQGGQVTVAFNSCPQACDGEAFSYLWPILVEAKSGRCF